MNATEEVRVLRSGSCPSLSGKSKLGYDIGCGPASEICVRVTKNTGSGYFSTDWVDLERVHELFEKESGRPITSFTLAALFKHRSANTPGFILAVLKHEALVGTLDGNRRCYERLDAKEFFKGVKALIASPGAAQKVARPRKAKAR